MPTQKPAAAKSTKQRAKKHEPSPTRRWSSKVTTDSTHPDKGLFLKSPSTIAHSLATKKVSPKGPTSGMRMLTFYINRAGRNLGKNRLADLEKAKRILSEIIASHKTTPDSVKHSRKKTSTVKSVKN
jgi:Protein of unknown function (DUF3175)